VGLGLMNNLRLNVALHYLYISHECLSIIHWNEAGEENPRAGVRKAVRRRPKRVVIATTA